MQIHADPLLATSVSVSPHEPYLVDSVGHVLMVSSISSDYYDLSLSSSVEFPILPEEGPNGDLQLCFFKTVKR